MTKNRNNSLGAKNNDSTGEIFVSIWIRNMACVPQFDTMHPRPTLGAFFTIGILFVCHGKGVSGISWDTFVNGDITLKK